MKINNNFELQNVCDEHLLIASGDENVDFSNLISLNPTAAFLWEKLAPAEEFTIEDMVMQLREEYDVEEDVAREDCKLIIEKWIEMGIVKE